MRMEEAFYNIATYLYNKDILEYAEIARSGPKSIQDSILFKSSENLLSGISFYFKAFFMQIAIQRRLL